MCNSCYCRIGGAACRAGGGRGLGRGGANGTGNVVHTVCYMVGSCSVFRQQECRCMHTAEDLSLTPDTGGVAERLRFAV